MSEIDLTTAMQLFDKEVTLKYQNEQFLDGTITERHGTRGDATNVPVSDEIEMANRSFAPANLVVTGITTTNKIVVPYDYALKTVIGGGEKTLFAYDEITYHSELHRKAIGRMLDYIKISSLFGDASFADIYQVAVDVGPVTGLSQVKMTEALTYLEKNAVPVYNREVTFWMPARVKNSFISDPLVNSILNNSTRPLTDNLGPRPNYLGVEFRTLGEAGINRIPYTTASSIDTYLVPMLHKKCMVQTFNRDPKTSITWVPQEDRYELVSTLTTGAKLIQTNGVVLIEADAQSVAN